MRLPKTFPEGYEAVRLGGVEALVVAAAAPWLRTTLAAGVTLAQWAEAQPGVERRTGRGRVSVVRAPSPGPQGRASWVVRHYWRGGAVAAPLLGDRYVSVGEPRPFRELAVSHEARRRGIPTPAVVAGGVYPAGPLHRADLVTELVPDATELAEVLFAPGTLPKCAGEALAEAGRLIRRMADAGLRHADLNARNVLVTRAGNGPAAHLLDLDRCAISAGPVPAAPMRRRLERSLRKLERRTGRTLDADAWTALRDASGGAR